MSAEEHRSKVSGCSGCLAAVVFLVFLCCLLLVALAGRERYRVSSWERRARDVKVGDTKQAVLEKMGEPTVRFGGTEEPFVIWEKWAYGSNVTFQKEPPYFFPFRWRLLMPDSDDVVVAFDKNGLVAEVRVPKR